MMERAFSGGADGKQREQKVADSMGDNSRNRSIMPWKLWREKVGRFWKSIERADRSIENIDCGGYRPIGGAATMEIGQTEGERRM